MRPQQTALGRKLKVVESLAVNSSAPVRYRIQVGVVDDVGLLVGRGGTHVVGVDGMFGQWQQELPLVHQRLRDGELAVVRAKALERHLIAPTEVLFAHVGTVDELAAGEERPPQILDAHLDAAFLVAAPRVAGICREQIARISHEA